MDNKIVVIAQYIVVKCKNHTVATPMSLYKQTNEYATWHH
jgi:hypothetical protein